MTKADLKPWKTHQHFSDVATVDTQTGVSNAAAVTEYNDRDHESISGGGNQRAEISGDSTKSNNDSFGLVLTSIFVIPLIVLAVFGLLISVYVGYANSSKNRSRTPSLGGYERLQQQEL